MKRTKWILSILLLLTLAIPALGQDAIMGRPSRALPQAYPDTSTMPERTTRYGEPITAGLPRTAHVLADEGSFFVATNPTPQTAIAHVVLTAFDDTKPYLLIRNQDSATSPLAKRIYIDYIKLLVNVVPASAAEWSYTLHIDYSTWAARYTSGGSAITPVNVNGDINSPSVAKIQVGAITAVAGVGSRLVSRGRFRGIIPTIYDEYVISFGANPGSGLASSAASGRSVINAPPLVLGPGQNLGLNMFGTSNAVTPAQFELEIGYWER